ncbi:hypothetical protein MTO98_11855 [Mucilaginibacter sp. SMC90]|uniref:hypothetical protein n=1 Tax=Mucilaginibacter sp. SMC90 TaxID=2929803 RepID=UPI001FB3F1B2|nr:hypothetical protein [Mucilaginibacter sp. SMC90]UOE51773.1 hypothetical protein MTO98_11855 [Mucilaginibacter sp. SMC90]
MNHARIKKAGRNISGLLFRNKYLIITSVVIFVAAASVYLLFLSPKYKVRMELSASEYWEIPTAAINELRSETTIEKAVKALGFQVSYYHEGTFTTTEIYGDSLPVKFMLGKSSTYDSPTEITINLINGNVCRIDQNNVLTDVPLYHPVKYASLNYTIVKGPAFKPIQPPLTVKLTPPAALIKQFSKSLNSKILSGDSFELIFNADNAKKGEDFLNKLVEVVNAQYAKTSLPGKPAVVDSALLTKLNDSITYYKAMADNYRQQQNILNNIKKPRRLPKPKPKPVLVPVTVQTPLTDKEKTDLNTLNSIKSYALKPNDALVIIPDNYQGGDYRIGALIQDFNKAQLNKQRVQQDSDNADASIYAFKLEINSVKDALVNSITQKEQKIRDAHQIRVTRQPKVVEQPKDIAPPDDIEPPKDAGPPKDPKSIASFIALQLNDSLARVNAIIKSKQQQYNRLLHGAGIQNTGPKLTITYKSDVRESMISKSLYVYLFAFLAGLLLPVLWLTINVFIISAKKIAAQ